VQSQAAAASGRHAQPGGFAAAASHCADPSCVDRSCVDPGPRRWDLQCQHPPPSGDPPAGGGGDGAGAAPPSDAGADGGGQASAPAIEGAPLDDMVGPYVPYQWKRKLSGSQGGGRYVERGECALRDTLVEGAIGPNGQVVSRDQVYAVYRALQILVEGKLTPPPGSTKGSVRRLVDGLRRRVRDYRRARYLADQQAAAAAGGAAADPDTAPPTDPAHGGCALNAGDSAICMLESGDIVAVTVLTVEYSPGEPPMVTVRLDDGSTVDVAVDRLMHVSEQPVARDPEEAKQQRREQARMWAAKALSRDEEMQQPCKVPLLGFVP
jgi:hypothetical protein